ncbi:MAG: response regulator [Desulfobacterales bacterium]|nr:response regulator [Desulfobacterales bacterium]
MDKIKILLVDDEEDFVETLSERIQMRNFDAEIAFNGQEALQLIKNKTPDVMVLDLKMPGMEGMEVLRRVKKDFQNVQVVVLTGHGSEKDEEEARNLGAFEYHQKPVDFNILVKTIKNAYKNKIDNTMISSAL